MQMPTQDPSPVRPSTQAIAARALVRSDGSYRRHGAARTAAAELSVRELIVAHELTHRHTHARRWTDRDRAVRDELIARSWGVGDLSRLRDTRAPRWLDPLIADALPTGRHRAGWSMLIGWLVSAYAAGAVGLIATYDELAAELGISRRTWARWRRELAAAQLVEVTATWDEPGEGRELRNRERAANLYRLGPAFAELALAAIESAPAATVDDRTRNAARAAAARARQVARAHRRAVELATRAAARSASPADAADAAEAPSSREPAAAVSFVAELAELAEGDRAAPPLAAPPQIIESAKMAPRPAPVPGSPTASTSPGHRPGGASGRSPTEGQTQRATHAPRGAAARSPSASSASSATKLTAAAGSRLDVAEPRASSPGLSEGDPCGRRIEADTPRDRDGMAAALAALRRVVDTPPPSPSGPPPSRGETREAAHRELARMLDALAAAVAERAAASADDPPDDA